MIDHIPSDSGDIKLEPVPDIENANAPPKKPMGTLRSERRVFIINLPYEEAWQAIRDWFLEKGLTDPFVTIIRDPRTSKGMGACHVDCAEVGC